MDDVRAKLTVEKLTIKYGDFTAVDSFSVSIRPGEFVVLLGPSGCGKTTTLRSMAGFISPSAGQISHGEDVISSPGKVVPPERRGMGMIFQGFALWPHMTAAENVGYGLRFGRGRREVEDPAAAVDAALESVAMLEHGDQYPGQLSGGQQQRVALARSLAVAPFVLLLDEPLSNLDALLRDRMRHELKRIHERVGFTAVYVTHDQAEALHLGDRVVIMNAGKIEQIGTPRELYTRPKNRCVAQFLGGADLLRGTVTSATTVSIGGHAVDCLPGTLPPSGEVYVVYRASNWRVHVGRDSMDLADGKALHGTVQEVVFSGQAQECRILIREFQEEVIADMTPYEVVRSGDEVLMETVAPPVAVPRDHHPPPAESTRN